MGVSVVIPSYNEEGISDTIKEIAEVLKSNALSNGSEIIIVDDGSVNHVNAAELFVDESVDVRVINNPHNMGYGFSLKRGISEARNDTVVITDADLTYPFSYVTEMVEDHLKGFDLVVGRRTGKNYRQSFSKALLR